MALYGALSKHNHLSEFNSHLEVNGNVLTPTQRRETAIANLFADAVLATQAGSGVSGSAAVYKTSVQKIGDIIKTRILIDLTGLNSSATGDIIGGNGLANCHIGQITAARNGTIFSGTVKCLEAPVTGDTDIDLYAADEATGAEDAAVTGLTETALLAAGGAWTIGLVKELTALPAANQYLYLTSGGAGADATYTAGKFLIEFEGYA